MDKQSLLNGNIKKQLIGLAIPLLMGNVLQQFYHTVDAMIIGRFLGVDAFAAAGIAGTIMNLFIFVLDGFCMGISVIFGMLYGEGDQRKFRQQVFVSLSLGSILTAGVCLVCFTVLKSFIRLIQTPEHLEGTVVSYLSIIIAGMIFTYLYNLFAGILRSIGDTKAALGVLFLAVLLNGLLDYCFVVIFRMGIQGAAYATVLAQSVAAACCYGYLRKYYREWMCSRQDIGIHRELVKKTVRFGCASALQESNLYIGKILVQGAVNTLGTAGIAAYTAATRLEGFANSFGDSGAVAMSIFISQNYGARDEKRVADGRAHGLKLLAGFGIALSVLMFVLAPWGMDLFLSQKDSLTMEYGTAYLRIVAVFYVLNFIGNSFVGYFRGTGRVHNPVIGTTINISTRVVLSYLLVGKLGLAAIAVATGIGWIGVVSYLAITYWRIHAAYPQAVGQ